MSESVYLGDFPLVQPASPEHLSIVFSAGMASKVHRWKNKNRSADFLADYFANFFPGDEEAPKQTATQGEMRSAIGYIANELLENAIKFNHDPACHMGIQLHLFNSSLVFVSTNSMAPEDVEPFQVSIRKLLAGDPGEMYLERLESNALSDGEGSGLGLLTMLHDYGAVLGWRFQAGHGPGGQPSVVLSTRVELRF